jgi:4-hydroxy-2-oxoglutarate aldolase
MNLAGVFIPAVTPFDPVTGDVDIVAMRANLRSWLAHPVHGIVIAGSTGEAVLLSREERRSLIEATAGAMSDDRLLIAGTGVESTRATVLLGQEAADAGADAVLVQPPAYFRGAMTPEVLRDHYRAVADASPVPVIIYQAPLRFSTLEFPSGLVAELSRHPNIVGIKDSRGSLEKIGELLDRTADGFAVIVGDGAGFYAALELGASAGILALANLAPAETAEIYQRFAEGRSSEAGRIQERVGPVHKKVVAGFGVAGVKAAAGLLGGYGGAPRPPLRPLPAAKIRVVEAELRRARLLRPEVALSGYASA